MSDTLLLDKAKIRQSFSAASHTYDHYAELQREVAMALLASFNDETVKGIILDLGCGTGFLTSELLCHVPHCDLDVIFALDIALPMLQTARCKLVEQQKVRYLCADAECLPIAGQSVDVVYSSLALQWCRNPEGFFADIKRIIKPGGRLVFSTFGPETLKELKDAWAEVDNYCHVNEFYSAEQLRQFLEDAGFTEIQMIKINYRPSYASVIDLMKELKSIGAHNVMRGRNKKMTTKAQMQQMIAVYEKHRIGSSIPATFTAILISAKA
jgi:malonyl-CoA O-methyltransferase